ncbi:MAG: hypothetical protein ABIH99_01360 [Candidatus Micrarchaeota archaeon]
MITGGKITAVEAKREKDDPISGLSINIGLDDVKVKGENIEINYTYTVNYAENVGTLKIAGVLYAKEDAKKSASIGSSWKKDKKLPDDFAELVLNTINFTCGTNGTLVVRPINLSPPMIPPKIEISKVTGAAGEGAA